jgi:hypothetical protein
MNPLDDPVPYTDEFTLCEALGWSWKECQETPPDVRQVFLLILEQRANAQKVNSKR